MFVEEGYEHSFLRDIAKESGVTTGAIYGHYKDKDALFTDIVSPVIDGLKKHLSKKQAGVSYASKTIRRDQNKNHTSAPEER